MVPSVGGYAAEAVSAPLSFLRKSLIDVTTNCIVTVISEVIFESNFLRRT